MGGAGAPGCGLPALVAALSLQFRLWYMWPLAIGLAVRHRRELRTGQLVVGGVAGAARSLPSCIPDAVRTLRLLVDAVQ